MTATELQKRNDRAQQLRVLRTDDVSYFVENADGKICYKVTSTEEGLNCSCGDFARGVKAESSFQCKHILAAQGCVTDGEVQGAEVLERRKPKLDERFLINMHAKDFVLYAGLLDLAHQKGLLKLDVTPIQCPSRENNMEAICVAVADRDRRPSPLGTRVRVERASCVLAKRSASFLQGCKLLSLRDDGQNDQQSRNDQESK